MTASEVGAVPDDVIEEVAMAIANDSDWSRRSESYRDSYRQQARAALSVPSVAEVFARDAKVRELLGHAEGFDERDETTAAGVRAIYSGGSW